MTSDFWPQSREGMSLCTEPPVCVPHHSSARSPTPCGATPDGGAPPQRGRGKGPQGARLAVASRGPRISEAPGGHPSRTGAQQGVAHGRCPLKHPFQPQGEASEQRTGRVHVRSGARPAKLRDPAGRGAGGDGWTWTARRYLAASAGEERGAGLSARGPRRTRETHWAQRAAGQSAWRAAGSVVPSGLGGPRPEEAVWEAGRARGQGRSRGTPGPRRRGDAEGAAQVRGAGGGGGPPVAASPRMAPSSTWPGSRPATGQRRGSKAVFGSGAQLGA